LCPGKRNQRRMQKGILENNQFYAIDGTVCHYEGKMKNFSGWNMQGGIYAKRRKRVREKVWGSGAAQTIEKGRVLLG